MILFKTINDLRERLDAQKRKHLSVGFVPTMGALHEGHISLVDAARNNNDISVCSIFINPTQFNDPSDFEKYPVTIEADIDKLEGSGCDLLFLPQTKEMYPTGLDSSPHYDLGYLEEILEGKFRPGHFQGVCMIVQRLLEIVKPDNLYLGQKDYQQCMVIRKLLQLNGMDEYTKLIICPTLREPDGLAMSSRNMRLDKEQRKKAVNIYKCLTTIKSHIHPGKTAPVKQDAMNILQREGFKVDYVEIADAGDLSTVDSWDGKQEIVALIAAFLGEVRLIDNMVLT